MNASSHGQRQLVVVLNEPAKTYRDSGNVRELALTQWAEKRGAAIWVLRDNEFLMSRAARLLAVLRLLGRLWRQPRAIVVMGYPAFPFFWSLDSIPQLMRAFVFIIGCKVVGVVRRQWLIVDIMDLPRFQHVDLHYDVRLPLWVFKAYDRCVYHLASQLWVCSSGIADLIKTEMFWGRGRVLTVENGAFPSEFDVPAADCRSGASVFLYAGQLFRSRGIEQLVDRFCQCRRDDVELRLCGSGGEWIPDSVSDPRVKYLGRLDEDDCARAVSECDVGIVFQPRGRYYDMVFPTKLPLYLARGKPVLATDNPELGRVVREMGVGMITSQERLAEVVDNLTADSVAEYASNARRVSSQVYWDAIYDRAYSLVDGGV